MERWEITTESGSLYRVGLDADGRWWIGGDNVATPTSRSLADGCWEIEPPAAWPPELGSPLEFRAPARLSREDPRRVPGGGKVTSRVVEVHHIPGSQPVRVPMGRLVMTRGAIALADELELDIPDLVARHLRGDWGRIGEDSYEANFETLTAWFGTVLSSYGEGTAVSGSRPPSRSGSRAGMASLPASCCRASGDAPWKRRTTRPRTRHPWACRRGNGAPARPGALRRPLVSPTLGRPRLRSPRKRPGRSPPGRPVVDAGGAR